MTGVYGRAARLYWRAGWTCPLPLPAAEKEPPPSGYTGHGARLVGARDLEQWERRRAEGNIALRMLGPLVGIDVDAYGEKTGAETLARAEAELGPLPATYVSSARWADGHGSGIRYFKLPPGVVLDAEAENRLRATFGEHIDIIRPDHRYALVWPSVHPDTASTYRWIDPTGAVLAEDVVPAVADIPVLGGSWVDFLAGRIAGRAGPDSGPDRPAPAPQPVHNAVDGAADDDDLWTGGVGGGEQAYSQAEADLKIKGGLAAVAKAPRGAINSVLNEEAFYLFHFVPTFIDGKVLARRLLEAQTAAWLAGGGRDDGDLRAAKKTITGASRAAAAPGQWRAVLADEDDEEVDPLAAITDLEDGGESEDEKTSTKVAGIFFTDARFSELVADHLRPGYRYTGEMGWMTWVSARGVWERSDEDQAIDATRRWVLKRWRVAARKFDRVKDDDDVPASERKRLEGAAEGWRTMCSRAKLTATVALARPQLRCKAEDFDAHPDLLNTPSGVVDLRTGDLRPHDRELYLTKCTRAPYRGADFADPMWEQALSAIPDDVRDWVQVYLGQGATGRRNTEGRLLLLDGDGENGKGVLVNEGAVSALGDYAVVLSENLLLANSGQHPTEKMALRGARLTLIDETPEARRLDTQRLKKLLDQPTLSGARYLYKEEMRVELVHTLVVSTNYVPQVTEYDHGTWRRLARLRMPFRFVKPADWRPDTAQPHERLGDPTLKFALEENPDTQAACLAWLVTGAIKWFAAGRQQGAMADRIAADVRAWRSQGDLIMNYVEERLVLGDPDRHVIGSELVADFNEWVKTQGNAEWSAKLFVARFGSHDQVREAKVERRENRRASSFGRPPSRPAFRWRRNDLATPAQYLAWTGVAFADEPATTAVPDDDTDPFG